MVAGHPVLCSCPCCQCLARVVLLLGKGRHIEGFLARWADRLRVFEGELRDEVDKALASESSSPKSQGGTPGKGKQPAKEGDTTPEGKGESLPAAFAKGAKTPPAPNIVVDSPKVPVKEEPGEEESKEALSEVAEEKPQKKQRSQERRQRREDRSSAKRSKRKKEVNVVDEEPEKATSSRRKESPEDRKRRRLEEDPSEDSSREARRRVRRRRREDSRGETRSPNSAGGRERKSRPDKPPEPPYPPSWVGRESQGATPKSKGKGWQGRIPYSHHPRWHASKNKGITKVAKQELHSRYSDRRHYR